MGMIHSRSTKLPEQTLEKARNGGGPTFIEALTYRVGAHSTADDPTKYRDPKEVEAWAQRDPIVILRKYLVGKKILDDKKDQNLLQEASEIVSKAAKAQEEIPPLPSEKLIFDDVYAELPSFLLKQRNETPLFGKILIGQP